MTPPIVLASASPRRKALLDALGLTFEVVASDIEESFEGAPEEMVVLNACRKRDDVAGQLDGHALIIAADTLVFLDEHVLGKPEDAVEAKAMVGRLSGKTHRVLTGLALVDTTTGRTADGFESTHVAFRPLAPGEIAAFVDAVNPIDRAGAYTVDGPGSLLVERYAGCYQNVLGLPIVRLDKLLRALGFNLFDMMEPKRSRFL